MEKMRKNAMSALLVEDWGNGLTTTVSANEWWNGEGVDFATSDNDETAVIHSFHAVEIEKIVAIAIAFNMVSIKECKAIARRLKNESKSLERPSR